MMNPRELSGYTVIVHSGHCPVVSAANRKLSVEFAGELRPFATVSVATNGGDWNDPVADVVVNGSVTTTNLIDYLAREMGQLRSISLVAVVATEVEQREHAALDRFMTKLKEVIGEMGQATCRDYRIAFPSYGAVIPREPFFTQRADANLISIPRDSASHDSIARPVSSDSVNSYAAHIAIELATSVGLWFEVDESVIEELQRINPGTDDVIVHWVSSRASYLVCPPLPIDRLMSEEGELPLPHGFHPVPDPQQAVERLARLIYPAELRYESSEPPSGPEYSESGKKLRWRYLRELASAAVQVPRALFRGVQDHLEGLAGAALQEAVGSSESSIEVIYPGRYVDEESSSGAISGEMVQRIIDDVSERVDRPVLTTIGEGLWVDIVDKVIAVADGGKVGAAARAGFADEKFLLVDQSALAPMADPLVEILQEIYVEPRREQVVELSITGEIPSSDGVESGTGDVHPEIVESNVDDLPESKVDERPQVEPAENGIESESLTDQSNSGEIVLERLSREPVDSSTAMTSSGDNPSEITLLEEETNEEDISFTRTLLREITGLLAGEQEEARSRAQHMVQILLDMPNQFRPRDARTISTAVRVAVALGFSLVYFTFGSLTERRHLVNFEAIGASNRDLLWTLVSTLVVSMAGFGLFLRSIGKSQGRIIASVTIVVVLLGAEFVFWKPIRDFVLSVDVVRKSALVGSLMMIGTLVVVALSIIRNRFSDNRLRRMFATSLMTLAWLYVVVGVTALMGSDRSTFRDLSSTTENRLVLMLLLTSFTLVMVSSFVVAYTIVRERYRLNEAKRQLQWATRELAESADAERLLRLASVQWLGTAAVIARLFRFPLGSDFSKIRPDMAPVNQSSDVLKFEQRPLILTKRGEQGLSARLRQLFIGQGWLGRQYRQLILRFQDDFAFSRGLQVSDVRSERPEGCSALPTLDDVFAGRARGPRWSFLRSVVLGEYDSALLDTTSEVQLEDAYSSIVVDVEAHSVGASNQTASSFFRRLIPSQSMQIPKGLVSVLFSGTDVRRLMIPYVWWPEELLQRPDGDMTELEYRAAPVLTPSRITDPIKLFGACVLVSHPFKLVDVNVGAGGFDDDGEAADGPEWGGGPI
jgi:hypothetical protein